MNSHSLVGNYKCSTIIL